MLILLITRQAEAEPAIARYRLKKDMAVHPFPVFKNGSDASRTERMKPFSLSARSCCQEQDVLLCVCGDNPVDGAAAMAYLAGRYGFTRRNGAFLLYVGSGCAASPGLEEGGLVYPHTVIDTLTSRVFYPEMLYRHPFKEAILVSGTNETTCVLPDYLQTSTQQTAITDTASALILQSAVRFIALSRIIMIYTVTVGRETATGNVVGDVILPWIEPILAANAPLNAENSDEIRRLLDIVADQLHLTHTMRLILEQDVSNCKDAVDWLRVYASRTCATKQEGKKQFALLRQSLME